MNRFWQLRYIISKHLGGYPAANWVSRETNKHTKTATGSNTPVTWFRSTNIQDNYPSTSVALTWRGSGNGARYHFGHQHER